MSALAAKAFHALRLRGYGRVDFRLSEDNRLYIFEVNANPLIGEESLMAVLARKMGWYFPTFIHNIALEAYRRHGRERHGITLRDLREKQGPPPGGAPPCSRPRRHRRRPPPKRTVRAVSAVSYGP